MSKREIPNKLQNKLNEFHVEVPEIPMKRSKQERLANWIYSPAQNPLEVLKVSGTSIGRLTLYPLVFVFILFITPAIFF